MGLFGGFKASFTRKIKKKTKQDNVVCLKYNVYSEFDTQAHTTSEPALNRTTDSVRQETNQARNNEKIRPSNLYSEDNANKKLPNLPERKPEHYYEEPIINGNVKTTEMYINPGLKSDKFTNDNEHKLFDRSVGTMNNTLYSVSNGWKPQKLTSNDDYEEVTPTEEYKLRFNEDKNTENVETVCEKSTLIFMTQDSLETEMNVENGEKKLELNVEAIIIPEKTTEQRLDKNFKINTDIVQNPEDEEEYKINVIQYDFGKSYSISDDELSDNEGDVPEFNFTGYSSQAASIFFGGDQKPTKLVLNNKRQYSEEDC